MHVDCQVFGMAQQNDRYGRNKAGVRDQLHRYTRASEHRKALAENPRCKLPFFAAAKRNRCQRPVGMRGHTNAGRLRSASLQDGARVHPAPIFGGNQQKRCDCVDAHEPRLTRLLSGALRTKAGISNSGLFSSRHRRAFGVADRISTADPSVAAYLIMVDKEALIERGVQHLVSTA